MAFVINVIKWLLWTVKTRTLYRVLGRDYVLSGIYYSVLVRSTCQHSQQTPRWPNAGQMLAHNLRRWSNINPALVQRLVFAVESGWLNKRWPYVVLMLDQRRRQWPRMKYNHVVTSAFIIPSKQSRRWSNIGLILCERGWQWTNVSQH